jgi:hypothetical protein
MPRRGREGSSRGFWSGASLLIAVALVFAVAAAPASSSGATAVAAKKCKKKHGHKKKCKKPTTPPPYVPSIPVLPPALSISPTSHNFGSVVHNNFSPTFTFVVTNTGGMRSNVGWHVIGTNANQFALIIGTNTCLSTLEVGASCQVGVKFEPTTTGPKSATLEAVGLYGVTADAALTGTGT